MVAGRQRMAWFSAQVVAARLARSVSQHHLAVQGHGYGAIQFSLAGIAVVPASHSVICSAISACFCRAPDSPRTVVGGRRACPTWSEPPPAPFVALARFLAPPYVLCVQTAPHPSFCHTVRVSCFHRTANAVGRWIGVPPRDNCGPFRLPLRYSPPRLAVSSDRMRRSPQSTVVFSLYQMTAASVAFAGRCCRRLHTLRFA